ncbi:HEPN domain-containing protein [Winogradskya humida]|uniref:Apea-like HEPN domain-containing protein n=1 Tax=Winogradskya humida TaxID=113566 RepID=A0ABQ4A1X7_9ACTN|nr:HEPN domain-containing protein [Actinoplanes humidus]GIE24623.1 hypothetical protein Ahu01nite_077250 [Actinoplanes humidus]
MAVDPHQTLTAAITGVLRFAWQHRDELSDPGHELREELADRLHDLGRQARLTARAHDYLHVVHEGRTPEDTQHAWGRYLSIRQLNTLGITGLLRDLPTPDLPHGLVTDLAGFLAGPAVPCERMFVIDSALDLRGPVDIAGWQLTRIESADLEPLTPLPSTRRFSADPWDEALSHGGCIVLRRISAARKPSEVAAAPGEPEVTIAAWQPLLLLNLAATDRIVATVATLEPLLSAVRDAAARTTGPDRKAAKSFADRLRRSAHRLLAQGPRLGTDGEPVSPHDRAEIVFWLISALEHLLIVDKGGDFTRKVAQRTAILIGRDGEDRLSIYRDVSSAYGIRSQLAHGDLVQEVKLQGLPARLYGYLREVFRALIILGPLFRVDTVCDDALLSAAVRQTHITDPTRAVVDRLPETTRSLRSRARAARPGA